jgi:hypothetical protein
MASIRVVEDEMTIKLNEIHPCLLHQWSSIKDSFQALDVRKAISQRSESFKAAIGLFNIRNFSWEKSSVFHNPSLIDPPAIYKLDGRGHCDASCGSLHRVNIVLCLNNREILGTNFLKLEIAAQEDLRNSKDVNLYDENLLGILITLSDGLLREGRWDSSYANSDEYSFAYKHAYRGFLKSQILSMQLHLI